MAVQEQAIQAPPTEVTLRRRESGFWSDAARRLIRNKAAVIGGIIIILIVLMAVFADTAIFTIFTGGEAQPLLAPQSYEKQTLIDNNAAPTWVTMVFPSMIISPVTG